MHAQIWRASCKKVVVNYCCSNLFIYYESMLLSDIVNGKEPSSCIILQDSLEASARPLMLSFMKSLLDRVDFVCLVCLELPPCRILNVFKTDAKSKLLPVDGYSNYLKWDGSDSKCSDNPLLFFDSNITEVVKKAVNRRCSMIKSESPVKIAIVLDSISKLINTSVSQTCQMLHHLSQGDRDNGGYIVDQVISLVHSDLHDSQSLETFCSTASSVLHILPSMVNPCQSDPEYEDKSDGVENYCKILHIKKTGKVLKKKQKYTVSHQLVLTEFTEEDWIPKTNIQPEAEKQTSKPVDPLSDLTFNLKLTRQEEQDRANTHLPYMHHAPPAQVKIHQNQAKESQIFYQPDEADDFDEDDPDDDLDI